MLAKSLTMLTLSREEGGSLKILTLGSERVGELGPRAQMKIKQKNTHEIFFLMFIKINFENTQRGINCS